MVTEHGYLWETSGRINGENKNIQILLAFVQNTKLDTILSHIMDPVLHGYCINNYYNSLKGVTWSFLKSHYAPI